MTPVGMTQWMTITDFFCFVNAGDYLHNMVMLVCKPIPIHIYIHIHITIVKLCMKRTELLFGGTALHVGLLNQSFWSYPQPSIVKDRPACDPKRAHGAGSTTWQAPS